MGATTKVPGNEALYARRLDAVRIFARHQHALDPATEVPPDDALGGRYRSHPPHQFTDAEIVVLLDAADTLTPRIKAATWWTVIGLLAATGVRPGEARSLNLHAVNVADGVVRIAKTKFGKSRLVFLHPTAAVAMGDYLRIRTDWMSTRARQCTTFFVNMNGSPINAGISSKVFRLVLATAGITAPTDEHPPRLHDLRHTFAVNTMPDWYRDGGDLQARLPLLSTWLGHVDPVSTYWYLQAVPELLALAAGRLEPDTRQREHRYALMTAITVATLLQGFFTDRLARQRQVSNSTIAAYRDAIRLLLMFAAARAHKRPSSLVLGDIDAATVGGVPRTPQHRLAQ